MTVLESTDEEYELVRVAKEDGDICVFAMAGVMGMMELNCCCSGLQLWY